MFVGLYMHPNISKMYQQNPEEEHYGGGGCPLHRPLAS